MERCDLDIYTVQLNKTIKEALFSLYDGYIKFLRANEDKNDTSGIKSIITDDKPYQKKTIDYKVMILTMHFNLAEVYDIIVLEDWSKLLSSEENREVFNIGVLSKYTHIKSYYNDKEGYINFIKENVERLKADSDKEEQPSLEYLFFVVCMFTLARDLPELCCLMFKNMCSQLNIIVRQLKEG